MIRVLHIVGDMELGGLETMIMNIYRNINRDEIQFDFLEYGDENIKYYYDDEIRNLGGKIYRLSDHSLGYFDRIKQHKEFLNNHSEYEIIHNHLSGVTGMSLGINILAKNKKTKKVISHSHNINLDPNTFKSRLKHNIMRLINNNVSNVFIACSKQASEFMFSKKISEKDTIYFYNPIDINKYLYNKEVREKIREELDLQDSFVVGHVGRFEYQKNHEYLIDIFNEILKINSNSKLVLCGKGILEKDIKQKIERLNIQDKVIFLGIRNDVCDIMQAFDVFVLPSRFEGLPLVAVEAQASNLPMFVSDNVPKEVEITNLVNYLSISDSPKNWAKNIMSNYKKYNRNVYEVNLLETDYSIKKSVKNLEKFYKN